MRKIIFVPIIFSLAGCACLFGYSALGVVHVNRILVRLSKDFAALATTVNRWAL